MTNTNLFESFNKVSAKEWKQKIQFDLKGADYNKTLVWPTNDHINVKPFYTQDDLNEIPFVYKSADHRCNITQTIYVNSEEKSNETAHKAINDDIDAIVFVVPTDHCNLETLLQNIDLRSIPIYFDLLFASFSFVEKLNAIAAKTQALFYVNVDSIGHLTQDGNWYRSRKSDFKTIESILQDCNYLKSSICVDTAHYQNAGANTTQQLAYGLAHANEYLNRFSTDLKTPITFKVAIGSNSFFEIAKLRALRILWHTLATAYHCNSQCHIIAYPSSRNKTIYDHKTNVVRITSEGMSAQLGGADSICIQAADALFRKNNELSEAETRVQFQTLKTATDSLDTNPTDGSFYIESLTHQLADKALDLFKAIEANGGFLKLLKQGNIQKKIKESAQKEQDQFDENILHLVGTNTHIDNSLQVKNNLELYPFVKQNPRKTLVAPIITKRLAETVEQHRLKLES